MKEELEARLLDIGIPCRVEVRDRLAIVVPAGEVTMNADLRAGIVRLAKTAGFTNIAVEIDPGRASLPRD